MVKIYKGIVVYQNIGNVIIQDAEFDDMKVHNIADINTLRVEDIMGLSSIKINDGTIRKYAVNNYDITNKKYVDDAVASGGFDPSQTLILTGNPSLGVKHYAYFEGNINIKDKIIEDYGDLKLINNTIFFRDSTDTNTKGSINNLFNDNTIVLSAYNNNDTVKTNKLYIMSGGGANFEAHDYNKGIKIDNNGLEIKGISTFDNDITIGTGTNQIQLSSAGDISGKTLTLSESIDCGTIKAGTGNNQITLDSTTGELKGVFLTTTGRIQAGTGTNQIILNTTNGKILGKTLELTENITAENEALNGTLTVNGITTLNNALYLKNTNHCINTYSIDNKEYLKMNSTGQIEISDSEDFNNATYGIKLYSNGNLIKGDTTLNGGNYLYLGGSDHHIRGIGDYFQIVSSKYIEISNNDRFNVASAGIKIISSNGTMQMKGNTTFNKNLTVSGTTSLNSGTISTAPSNNNDIVNKAYVDSVVSGGVDPSVTLHLTNSNSLITDGDITSKTLYKTEKASNDITYTLKYTIDRNLNNPAGLFYCPSNNKLYTVKSGNLEASYIVIYDIATGTTTTKEITKENVSMSEVISFNGFYNIYGYYNIPRDPYILITGNDSNNDARYCYYDINTDTLSILRSTSPVDVQASAKISYNGWEYFYTDQANTTYNLYIKSRTDYYPARTDIYLFNLSDPPKYLLPLNSEKQYFITLSSSKINLYRFNNSSTLITLDSYDTSNTTIKKIIYNNESDSCFVIGKNKVYKVDVVNDLLSVNLALDLSSNNSLTIYGGIVNYDGTLYLTSYSSTSPYTTYIQQYILTNGTLKLISELARTNQKLTINYLVCAENKIYSVCKNANTNQYYSNIAEITTNKNSIISNNQTSLNGILSVNNSSTFNYNNNDILTVGMLIKLLKNFTCVHGECLDMSYLQDNTFINSTKFINSC